MEASYTELAKKYAGSHVKVAKFQADLDREFSTTRLGLKTFPTIVMLPKTSKAVIKFGSERRDVDTLDMWVKTTAGYQ